MIDVVIVSIPRIAPVRPAAALPLLKELCNKVNKTSRVLDLLNQDFSSPELLWIIKEQNPGGINLEDTIFSTSSQTLNEIKNFFGL